MQTHSRHIRDVFAAMPALERFRARLDDPEPFTEAEIARAHFVLSQGRTERQATLPLDRPH